MTDPEQPTNDSLPSGDSAPAGPASASEPGMQVIHELFVLCLGLVIGYFWCLYSDAGSGVNNFHHIIIGLTIIVGFLVRYIRLATRQPPRSKRETIQHFLQELTIFSVGLVGGFLWYMLYDGQYNSVHLVVVLLIVLYGLGRYIALRRVS